MYPERPAPSEGNQDSAIGMGNDGSIGGQPRRAQPGFKRSASLLAHPDSVPLAGIRPYRAWSDGLNRFRSSSQRRCCTVTATSSTRTTLNADGRLPRVREVSVPVVLTTTVPSIWPEDS